MNRPVNPVRLASPAQAVDGRTTLAGARAPVITDGRVGDFWVDTAAKKLYGPKTSAGWPDKGLIRGAAGWYPLERIVSDGARRVTQIYDWAGGEGSKPATGYKTAAGAVSANIADGVDIRGAEGPPLLIDDLDEGADALTYASQVPMADPSQDNEKQPLIRLFGPSGNVGFPSVDAAEAATIPASIQGVKIWSLDDDDGDGQHDYRRADADPGSLTKFRSVDRFLSDGETDPANGGWWVRRAPFRFAAPGSVPRDVRAKLRDIVSVCDFGAVGDDSTDCTQAFQDAHDALPNGGGIYVPRGFYRISDEIELSNPVTLYGDGHSSVLIAMTGDKNILKATGARVAIRGLRFITAVTRTAGWYVEFTDDALRCRLSDFFMESARGGVHVDAEATITIERGEFINSTAAAGICIRLDAGFDVTIRDILVDNAAEIFSSVYITKAGDVTVEDCQLINAGTPLLAEVGTGDNLSSLWCNNVFFDNSVCGGYLRANGGVIDRSMFDQCWFSSNQSQGLLIESLSGGTINGVSINSPHVFGNAAEGISVKGSGTKNVRVLGGAFAGNGDAGIKFGDGVTDFGVAFARIGSSFGFGANGVGIAFLGSNNNFTIAISDLRTNTAGAFFGAPSADATKLFVSNLT